MSNEKRAVGSKNKTSGEGQGVSSGSMLAEDIFSGNAAPKSHPRPNLNVITNPKQLNLTAVSTEKMELVPVSPNKRTELVGFLVSYEGNPDGLGLQLRAGNWLVTSKFRSQYDGALVIPHRSIAETHAVLKISTDNKIEIIDQLSETGTYVRRADCENEQRLSGSAFALEHGDCLRFGERNFTVCVIPKPSL